MAFKLGFAALKLFGLACAANAVEAVKPFGVAEVQKAVKELGERARDAHAGGMSAEEIRKALAEGRRRTGSTPDQF